MVLELSLELMTYGKNILLLLQAFSRACVQETTDAPLNFSLPELNKIEISIRATWKIRTEIHWMFYGISVFVSIFFKEAK